MTKNIKNAAAAPAVKAPRKPRSKVNVVEVKAPTPAPITRKRAPKAAPAPQIENDNKLTPAEMPDPVPSMTKKGRTTPLSEDGVTKPHRKYATGPKQNHSEYGEGVCAMIHELYFIALKAANNDPNAIKRADVLKEAVAEGADIHTAKTQFQRARSWNLAGHTEPKPRRVKGAKKADAVSE